VEVYAAGETGFAIDSAGNFGARKNEAAVIAGGGEIEGGVISCAFTFSHVGEVDGLCQSLRVSLFTDGLQGFELDGVLFDGTADALFVEGEKLEALGLLDPGFAFGERGIDLGMAG
jgi:hypothetical protein